jgi:5,10-methylenetetrahydromethanopterin reductase
MSAAEVVELAVLVEDVGFDRLGISDVILWPDCFMLQALCARATSRVRIASMVTNPYSRHPVVLAGAVATLQDISAGRAFLGLGVGAGLEAVGGDYPRPVRTLRESVSVIRGLLAGETVDYRGETVSLEASRLVVPPDAPAPIAIGTRSPQVMRLAGEIADMALVGGRYWSPDTAATYRAWLAEGAARVGRDPAEIDVAPRLTLCVSSDGDAARRAVTRYVAHYLTILRPSDLDIDPGRITAMESALGEARGWYFDHDRYDPPELFDLVDDDLIRRFAVAGTPEECAAQVRDVVDLGFTSLSMNLAAVGRATMFEGLRETIVGAGEMIALLRA